MDHERLKRLIWQNIDLYHKGFMLQSSVEYLDMIIAAHELKKRNDPDADEIIRELSGFMMETDGEQPLHYSLWLALFPLYSMPLSDFLQNFAVHALSEDYQPETAVNGSFHDRLETGVSLPISAHSELIREEVNRCLAEKNQVSAALERWMAYENELTRRRNSFEIKDVLSVYYEYAAQVLNMDAFEHAGVSAECVLKIDKEGSLNEIPLKITHVYDDMITALSIAKPLHLYRIFRNEPKAECYRLSDNEFRGFHVGMLLADDVEINENNIRARLMDPAGGRYDVSGIITKDYHNRIYDTEITFEDGAKKKAAFYLAKRHFVLIELSQGYSDFLKDYR